jgi:hypothetical protein
VASHRERAARGRTFEELARDCLVAYPRTEETLRRILREEVELGRIDYRAGRYVLNGHLPRDVKEALAQLRL